MHTLDIKNSNKKQIKRRIQLPITDASIKSEAIEITEDIKVYKNNFTIFNDCTVKYNYDLDGIVINIVFCADHHYKSTMSQFAIYPKPNHTLISYIQNDKGNIFYKKNSSIQNIMISIKPSFLKSFLKNSKTYIQTLQKEGKSKILKNTTTNNKTNFCAREIYNVECKNTFDILFIQSKALEIISYELEELLVNKKDGGIKFSSYDIKALHLAHEILCTNFTQTPSVSQLSKMVKLNEFKLKYGFKTFYKNTPYNIAIQHKMLKAKELIKHSDLNINQIAQKLGYKQTHNLTTTFKKHFGFSPKQYMKKYRAYY